LHYRKLKENNGTTFYGTKGWISLGLQSAESNISEINQKLNDFSKNDEGWINSDENTMGQLFVDVVTGKVPEACPIADAIISDCVSHMGNIAIRTNRKITWDPAKGEVLNDPQANKWFVRDMREPYAI